MLTKHATLADRAAATTGMLAAWRDAAACRDRAGLLDPDHPEWLGTIDAKAFCRACPVVAECGAWVLSLPRTVDVGGVCGGTTKKERARARGAACPDGGAIAGGDTKYCPRCATTQPVAAFWRDRGRGDGLKPYCKPCTTEMVRAAARRKTA